ncbi:hypothetical protein BS47DRAFT_1365344 [Hydnum rufescens UP504]|uniref:Uncharacterized protein n=1 Tax=Hydnum rufescens UP504 TaxID=1448309 RepID=A0A9P6APZ0_9AGAM|nr:hypothetical protein BS47DRAFT_1365344 [Hydnum rufescens UP504]
MSPDFLSCKFELTYYSQQNVTSQEPSYPQINIGRCKVDDEANDEVNDETANMEKSCLPGGNQRNKKFHVITSTPSQPPKNQAYIQLESHPKIPEVKYQHESWRSASLLNGTPTSSQVDYPNNPPLLPIQSSEPERASSTFGYNEEPTVLLSGSHMLALNLPTSIPEACPGDLLYVWDATQVDTLLWSLPDQGADPSEDCINVSCLAKEMRWGPCGTLGIIEGLAFFANTCGLKLEQFEIKILKLVKALKKSRVPTVHIAIVRKSPLRESHYNKHSPFCTSSCAAHSSSQGPLEENNLVYPSRSPMARAREWKQFQRMKWSHEMLIWAQILKRVDREGQPHQPQYNRGPFPTALVDGVHGVTEAFHHTLGAMAKKYNCPLHQVLWLANLGDSFHSKWLPNLFNGYSRKQKLAGLPKLSPGGLRLKYAKEKEQFNGDADCLEAWLDDLRSLAQQLKVDKDVQVTSGTKLAKYIHQKKKLLMECILFGSSEIQQLAKKQFNLKKSLEELFVKLMNERLDATGILKWHEEAEKVWQEHELKTRDSAYSTTSKYLRNLFISNGHAWFLVSVPWHHIRFIGWLLEEECPAPHPSHTNKSWEGGQWRFLVSEFQKGNSCPIKLEIWGKDDADDDTAVPLVIDRDGNAVRCVQDAGLDFGSKSTTTSTRQPKLTLQKSQKAPASAAKSKGISFSDFEIGSSSGFKIGSSSEFKIGSSSGFKIGSSSKCKIRSSSGVKIGSSSKFKIGASSEFEFELFGNFEFGPFNGFEFGTFSDFEFGSFGDIKFKSCGHDAPWCWSRWCLEL